MKEISMVAAVVLDFTHADLKPNGKPEIDPQGRTPDKQGGRPAKSMSRKQIRARARRKNSILQEELELLYKPIDQWDADELARGYPKAKDGTFKGKKPAFIDRALHEQIVKRFEEVVRLEMNGHTIEALAVVGRILADMDEDEKGRPMVPASVKLDAAKFLIEHVIGKPKQRTESDISIKLQGILGVAMANPNPDGTLQLTQGYIDAESSEEDDDGDTS
jgi:hypothetical protein